MEDLLIIYRVCAVDLSKGSTQIYRAQFGNAIWRSEINNTIHLYSAVIQWFNSALQI